MAKIFHFVSADNGVHEVHLTYGTVQANEYIVISDEDESYQFKLKDFVLDKSYELDDTGVLPTERILVP